MVHSGRITIEKAGEEKDGPVVYWMSRDQRVSDNWALLHSIELAKQRSTYTVVVFCLDLGYPSAISRTFNFMVEGLKEVEANLTAKNIPFLLQLGDPTTSLSNFLCQQNASILVTDFDPLRIKRQWKKSILGQLTIPIVTVDAHNIVPCRIASPKQEFGAYTIRPKINKLLNEYLQEFPSIEKQILPENLQLFPVNWPTISAELENIPAIEWIKPGEKAAKRALIQFLNQRLEGYATKRNLPELGWLSNLSPFLHFGHIAPQRVALEVINSDADTNEKDAFLEELIVRRELSDNFCFYNSTYDSFDGLPSWAKKSLDMHRSDEREYVYPLEVFEKATTHDKLWNAAQNEMMQTGKMHGYMRMYWAKKILEWTTSPEEAISIAIYLNDKYSIDGRDPNGYTGIAWAIGGLHDRAWFERPIFGKIRYMNSNGAQRKFNVKEYINKNSF